MPRAYSPGHGLTLTMRNHQPLCSHVMIGFTEPSAFPMLALSPSAVLSQGPDQNSSTTHVFQIRRQPMLKNRPCSVLPSQALLLSILVITPASARHLPAGNQAQSKSRPRSSPPTSLLPYYTVFDNLASSGWRPRHARRTSHCVRPLKSDAEAAVKSVEAISGVTNNIEVLPPSRWMPVAPRTVPRIYGDHSCPSTDGLRCFHSYHRESGHVSLEGLSTNDADRTSPDCAPTAYPMYSR